MNQAAFEEGPAEWTPVLEAAELEEHKLTGARASDVGVLLVREGERLYDATVVRTGAARCTKENSATQQ